MQTNKTLKEHGFDGDVVISIEWQDRKENSNHPRTGYAVIGNGRNIASGFHTSTDAIRWACKKGLRA